MSEKPEKTRRSYRVRNPQATPPGGWVWRHEKTGIRIQEDGALEEIVDRVQAYLLRLYEDPSVAEDEIHQITGKNLITRGHADLVEVTEHVGRDFDQLRSGAKARLLTLWKQSPLHGLLHGKVSRGEEVFVGKEAANRRAEICAGCEANVIPASKGWLQSWADGQMLAMVENRTVRDQEKLGVCEVCSCELRAAVWWDSDILISSMRGAKFVHRFPAHCWKKKLMATAITQDKPE